MSYFKVVNNETNSAFYFSDKTDCVFKPPLVQVREFLNRNGSDRYSVYIETCKPKPFPRWVLFRI